MKKLLHTLLSMVFILSFTALSAFAYTPVDGDVTMLFGAGIEIGTATDDGVPINAEAANGAVWAGRATFSEPVALDGLSFTFKDLKFKVDGNVPQLFLGFSPEPGAWIDSKCLMFVFSKCSGNVSTYPVGEIKYGVTYAIQDYDLGAQNPIIPFTQLDKPLEGDFTVSVKKTDKAWDFTFNGQTFSVPNDIVTKHIPDPEEAYINFGFDGQSKGGMSFTFGEVKASNIEEIELPELPEEPTSSESTPNESSTISSTPSPTNSDASAGNESLASSEGQTASNSSSFITIGIIIGGVVILAAVVVVCVLIVLKKKKS